MPKKPPEWETDDPDYPTIKTWDMVHGPPCSDEEIGQVLARWFGKIAELAFQEDYAQSQWNLLVAALWLDSSRIIGHLQMDDDDIGYDTGFRVCAFVPELSYTWDGTDQKATEFLRSALKLEQASLAMRALGKERPDFSAVVTIRSEIETTIWP